MSEPEDEAAGDEDEEGEDEDEEEAAPGPLPPTCCPMRRKVVVGILAVLPETQCGVGDSELADFLRFDLETPGGKPVLAFRFCPWCGAARAPDAETRIVDVDIMRGEQGEGEGDEEGGFEPPSEFEPPGGGGGDDEKR